MGIVTEIAGQEARHILLAKRIKKGEKIKLQGPDGKRFLCEIINAAKNNLSVKPVTVVNIPEELGYELVLFQAAVAEQAWDTILQKATELRVSKIILFNSVNTANKMTAEKFENKYERWQKILWESAKQSDRGRVPELLFVENLDEVVKATSNLEYVVLLDPGSQKTLKNCNLSSASTGLIVGPEGGFIQLENERLKCLPACMPVTLGPVLLRADTAVITGISIIQNLLT